MSRTTHLNALQAVELALRLGSIQAAAQELGITPAAVGQRIRALERYLDTDLIVRGRSGLHPTPALDAALGDLRLAFAALDRASERLDFQRSAEIHVVADPDWADLWLVPRLDAFRSQYPNILFNVNGEGDVPMRLGAADVIVDRDPNGRAADGKILYYEAFLPVGSHETAQRVSDPYLVKADDDTPRYLPVGTLDDERAMWRHSKHGSLEGFPLLHIKPRPDAPDTPNWRDWLEQFPYERTSPERGVQYALARNAIEGVKSGAGLLVCGLSCILAQLDKDVLLLPFHPEERLVGKHPYRLKVRNEAVSRPQVARFLGWLEDQARETVEEMQRLHAR